MNDLTSSRKRSETMMRLSVGSDCPLCIGDCRLERAKAEKDPSGRTSGRPRSIISRERAVPRSQMKLNNSYIIIMYDIFCVIGMSCHLSDSSAQDVLGAAGSRISVRLSGVGRALATPSRKAEARIGTCCGQNTAAMQCNAMRRNAT